MIAIYHSNRLERLADDLAGMLRLPGTDPLRARPIVVPNPGTERWLCQRLAGLHGIAANLDFPLPATFLWRVLRAWMPEHEVSPLDRDTLAWRIQAALPDLLELETEAFEDLDKYLRGADPALRLFQLSQRIAASFDQYLVFRPRMVLGWEQGEEDHWQARLWRRITEGARNHRARLLSDLLRAMERPPLHGHPLCERVFIFGLNALPPIYLEILKQLGRHVDLHIYHLNPSREYWADLVSEKARRRRALAFVGDDDPFAPFLDLGHPLLASMGHVGQVFLDQLLELEAEDHDHFEEPAGGGLLQRLQRDILELRDGRANARACPVETWPSIQVHGTHTPLREVQVLHDYLLRCFQEIDSLKPREILVMAPDMAAYAPFVEAVFATAPPERAIPFAIADRPTGGEDPLSEAIRWLLRLPESRLGATEVLALLEVDAVQRRLGLDETALERIRTWVRETGIRWAVDERHRRELGLPGDAALNSWRFGLRRLFLGFVTPVEGPPPLYGGTPPYLDIEGEELLWAGALQELIERLDAWRKGLGTARRLPQWREDLLRLWDDFFAVGEAERELFQALSVYLDDLVRQAAQGGLETELPPSVIRELLDRALGDRSGTRGFLHGGVTFSNLLPMRALPFRVICLLGMNDTDYPRPQRAPSFDLMAGRHRRRGDRDRRLDDRYLFLEALLSARDALFIGYQSRDARSDQERLPAEVVSELLDYLDACHPDQGPPLSRRLCVQHPLQPFSHRYFDGGDARLFTYDDTWACAREGQEGRPFHVAPLPEKDLERLVELEDLIRFFKNPTRAFLSRRLAMSLPEDEPPIEDVEPFTLDDLQDWGLRDRLLGARLAGEPVPDLRLRLVGEGGLPHGVHGEILLERAGARIEGVLEEVRRLTAEDPPQAPLALDLALGGWRLVGTLGNRYGGGLLAWRAGRLRSDDRLSLWLRHLAHCAADPGGGKVPSRFVAEDATLSLAPVPSQEALTLLEGTYLDLYRQGMQAPLPFFPRSAWKWMTAGNKRRPELDGNETADAAVRLMYRDRPLPDEACLELAGTIYRPLLQYLEET